MFLLKYFTLNSLFIRNTYLKKVEPYIGKEIIKALTGQRRVGKTILLKQIQHLGPQLDKKSNTIYVNKEQHEFKQIKNADDLSEYFESQLKPKQSNYIFIDEIQEIQDFEIALRQLLVKGVNIYCTGSNANMLSWDLATYLSGRYIEFLKRIMRGARAFFLAFLAPEKSKIAPQSGKKRKENSTFETSALKKMLFHQPLKQTCNKQSAQQQ